MENQYTRTIAVLGEDAIERLKNCRVAVFGVGGVGSYIVEALARAGVGAIDLIDNDTFNITNINRQLYATHKTVGQYKVDVAAARIHDINPECKVTAHKMFYLPENAEALDLSQYDYIVDAIDTVAAKVELIVRADKVGTRIISSMGTGNKLHPELFEIADIYKTSVCPLAKVMRTRLKKEGIKKLKVVYSKEEPITNSDNIIGSVPFVPSVAGLIIAGEVIKEIVNNAKHN
ncbi:MAG: tRNA threonylcarbamoyladenosine dehydratase [Clostridia bacterium]|nr:tRNA threonylcarbamoyladenosine dehydratase [Clostridia bacterium]